MGKIIYADHSATTFVKDEVLKEMLPYFCTNYGNASSIYSLGRKSRKAIENSRRKVSSAIGANSDEIYFTAGGSESDNMIIKGIASANRNKGNHIITTKIEHLAILNTCKELEKQGFDVTYLDVDNTGMINIDELKRNIRKDTILISVMFANNEIGTIEPIDKIGIVARETGIIFHTDAVQAIGNIDIDVKKLNIDALSMSAHKFYGPKGVGAAYIKSGVKFTNLIQGGHQECSRRAGTENVPGIVGMGKAIELVTENIIDHVNYVKELRDLLIQKIESEISGCALNGLKDNRLCGNVNFCIKDVDSESLIIMLDMEGICASSGSACNSGSLSPSHVLKAIKVPDELAINSVRFTLGDENTKEDVEKIFKILKDIVNKIRNEKRNNNKKCVCTK